MPVLAEAWDWQGRDLLAVIVDPLQSHYHWDLGHSRVASGDLSGSVTELQRAADLGETDPQLYVDLGDAEMQVGDRAAAKRAYEMALHIDPYFAPAHERLADLGA